MRRLYPALAALALALASSAAWITVADVVPAAAAESEGQMAAEIAAQINNERAARGLSRLPVDASYSAGAQRVAESNRARSCDACHSSDHHSGEVVYWDSGGPSGAATVWWMNSAGHRALLLAPNATRLGVGVACSGTEYQAVGWIETPAAAQGPPSTPIVTGSGSGTSCSGVPAPAKTTTTVKRTPTTTGGAVEASAAAATKTAAGTADDDNAAPKSNAAPGGTKARTTPKKKDAGSSKKKDGGDDDEAAAATGRRTSSRQTYVIRTGAAPTPSEASRRLGVKLTGRASPATTATTRDFTPLVLSAVFGAAILTGWIGRRRPTTAR